MLRFEFIAIVILGLFAVYYTAQNVLPSLPLASVLEALRAAR